MYMATDDFLGIDKSTWGVILGAFGVAGVAALGWIKVNEMQRSGQIPQFGVSPEQLAMQQALQQQQLQQQYVEEPEPEPQMQEIQQQPAAQEEEDDDEDESFNEEGTIIRPHKGAMPWSRINVG